LDLERNWNKERQREEERDEIKEEEFAIHDRVYQDRL
jgi:hypothetical protein